jgi:hypothetical protein
MHMNYLVKGPKLGQTRRCGVGKYHLSGYMDYLFDRMIEDTDIDVFDIYRSNTDSDHTAAGGGPVGSGTYKSLYGRP